MMYGLGNPIVKAHPSVRLLGFSREMSLNQDVTASLWQQLMPRLKALPERPLLYSLQVYPEGYFNQFDPDKTFLKMAAVKAHTNINITEGMVELLLEEGLYVVFPYQGKGGAAAGPAFRYIFNDWLPASSYQLDQRPHFELLGDRYARDSGQSEEEIWIPVR